MRKIYLLISIMIIVCVCISLVACTTPSPNKDIEDTLYQTWMQYIKDDTLIKDIVIPGSHDSGTIGMNFMYSTQNTTIKQQLYSGVRYFDIRVRKDKDNLVIFHAGSSGVEFIPILKDIVEFIENHPSELLILDFQHFDKDSEEDVLKSFNTYGLDKYAITNNSSLSDLDFIDTLKLKDTRGKVLICWGRDKGSDSPLVFRRNNDECTLDNCVLDSYYYGKLNRMSSKKYIDEGLSTYYSLYEKKGKGIWVLQGQLTKPGANLYNLESKHNENMTNYINNLANDTDRLNITNIIMRDFIGNDLDKINSILALNKAKGITLNK